MFRFEDLKLHTQKGDHVFKILMVADKKESPKNKIKPTKEQKKRQTPNPPKQQIKPDPPKHKIPPPPKPPVPPKPPKGVPPLPPLRWKHHSSEAFFVSRPKKVRGIRRL